jgi:superfamily II DNA or RNA helicase
MSSIPLQKHQRELLDGISHALSTPPGAEFPYAGLRATLVSATGTGKTLVGIEAARRLAPRGRVLVMVPTLALLTQTVEVWREAGHGGPAIAVCSLRGDELLGELDVRCTTSAPRLALWGGGGPVTVFATYASLTPRAGEGGELVPGPLEEAMAGLYGQRLAPFDLAIVDEAHRTSGAWAKPWAAIHDNSRIPAKRRLYMTATPRLWEIPGNAAEGVGDSSEPSDAIAEETAEETGRETGGSTGRSGAGEGGERLVASMDDESLYGPHVTFGLMEAIERGILASFEIDVLEIRDPSAGEEGLTLEEARGRRLAALQAALLTHLDATGARSLITFHHRTREAMAFARGLSVTAAELHEADPGRYPKPEQVWAEWLCGEHSSVQRRRVLRQFADGIDAEGWVTEASFLASCRILGEGVDVTGRRGVDGVVFADTRGSVVDVVQNVGRGLRQAPGEGKVARIVVPVFLQPGEDPSEMVSSPSYRPLVAVLQGLRAHDERVIEHLTLRREHSGRGKAEEVLIDDPAHVREGGGERDGAAGNGQEAADWAGKARAGDGLLRFSTPRDPAAIARFLRTRVLQPDSEVWLTGYQHLCRWVEEHGHAQVPTDARVLVADGGNTYALGQWVAEQRRAHREGVLRPWRFELLDELGVQWDVHDARFAEKLGVFRRYAEAHGTLAAPPGAVFDGHPVGQDLANLRKPNGLGKKPERAAERRRQLAAIDPDWNPDWPVPWQRRWAKARMCLEGGARLEDLLPGVVVDSDDIGAWLTEQRASWKALSGPQRERLEQLGVQPPADESVTSGARGTAGPTCAETVAVPATATAWERGIAAARQYQRREGHTKVPRAHRELVRIDHGPDAETAWEEVRLGVWRSNVRSRRGKLTEQQRQQAQELGLLA